MMTVRYIAEMTDPITQETTTIEATSEAELEHLVDQHLQRSYSDTEPVSSDLKRD